jgi:hypothetical protein
MASQRAGTLGGGGGIGGSVGQNNPRGINQINRQNLIRALEVTLDRCSRFLQASQAIYFNRNFLERKSKDVALKFAMVLGIIQKDKMTESSKRESNLLAPSLAMLMYSFTVCWGQFYVLFWVYATWITGSLIIFILFKLLGASHDLSEVMATIGFAITPLLLLEPLMTLTEEPLPGLSVAIKTIAVGWASRSASLALIQPNTEKKTFLFAWPLILFNVYLLSLRSGA